MYVYRLTNWFQYITLFCPTGSFIWHMTTIIRSRKANEQNNRNHNTATDPWLRYFHFLKILSLSQLWIKETLQRGDNGFRLPAFC